MNKGNGKSIGIFSNTFWSIYNFRRSLIKSLLGEGYTVFAISAHDRYEELVKSLGCETIRIKNFDAQSTAVLKEASIIREVIHTIKALPCEYIYTFTIKPNLYTALTSALTNKKVILTVNGLGNVFSEHNFISKISLQLFKRAFKQAYKVVFQNQDDFKFFKAKIKLNNEKVLFVRGSGVDTTQFDFSKKPLVPGDQLTFLLACRLLKEKGVQQYIEAAKHILGIYPNVKFWLLGMEANNPSAIRKKDLEIFEREGIITLLPQTDNINALLDETDVLVLPSFYNEGVPRILLEGLSKGLPLVTTNSVGCRETVVEGRNGYLIAPRSVDDLEKALRKIIELPVAARMEMRKQSRQLAESEFDEKRVIENYINIIQEKPPQLTNLSFSPIGAR